MYSTVHRFLQHKKRGGVLPPHLSEDGWQHELTQKGWGLTRMNDKELKNETYDNN